MKTLVIIAHPSIETSKVNKRWMRELKKYPDRYTVHELYKVYPDGKINVENEQALVETHDNLILQFPVYWFNSPPLLKTWLDDVLTYGWAFGSNGGHHLRNRKVALAVTAGSKKSDYSKDGKYQHTLDQILLPFKITFLYCHADYQPSYVFYGADDTGGTTEGTIENELTKSAKEYLRFIDALTYEPVL